jgi:hypothetical protein
MVATWTDSGADQVATGLAARAAAIGSTSYAQVDRFGQLSTYGVQIAGDMIMGSSTSTLDVVDGAAVIGDDVGAGMELYAWSAVACLSAPSSSFSIPAG